MGVFDCIISVFRFYFAGQHKNQKGRDIRVIEILWKGSALTLKCVCSHVMTTIKAIISTATAFHSMENETCLSVRKMEGYNQVVEMSAPSSGLLSPLFFVQSCSKNCDKCELTAHNIPFPIACSALSVIQSQLKNCLMLIHSDSEIKHMPGVYYRVLSLVSIFTAHSYEGERGKIQTVLVQDRFVQVHLLSVIHFFANIPQLQN